MSSTIPLLRERKISLVSFALVRRETSVLPAPAPSRTVDARRAAATAATEREPAVLAHGVTGATDAPALRNGGTPLDPVTRAFFAMQFGAGDDALRDVRVHTGPSASAAAMALGARAYTSGSHVVFGDGEYRPGTRGGDELLAHELTHVLQQRAAGHGGTDGAGPVGRDRYGGTEGTDGYPLA